jgi:hypothetical protein
LLRRSRAVLSLANMFHLLAYKFACLRRRRFAFVRIFPRPFDCLLFWHGKSISPQEVGLVVRGVFRQTLQPKDGKTRNLHHILDYLAKRHTLSLFDVG